MIPALASLSIGQRIVGAALLIALWLAPAAVVWINMDAKRDAAYDLGKAEARTENAQAQTNALATAIKEARDEWKKTQAAIDEGAAKDAKTIAADLAAVRRQTTHLTKELQTYVLANPLPPDCRADPERVRLWNQSRRGDHPEG